MQPRRVDPASPAGVWLAAFAAAVRDDDRAAGRALCRDDVEGFGTVADRYVGLDRLDAEQWHEVWPRTRDFAFDLATATAWHDGGHVVVMAEWSSTGVEPDGTIRPRRGRATIALGPVDGVLLAHHTHFSMLPGTLS